jgi:hypothetical protein
VYQGDRNARLEAELHLNALKDEKIENILVVREFEDVISHKYRGSYVAFSISKSVEPTRS